MNVSKINLKKLPSQYSGELSQFIFSKCCFCEKRCKLPAAIFRNLSKLSGDAEFFCSFCIRNGLNTKNSKDFLILSFRAIIGFYYVEKYLNQKVNKVWLSQIEDLIESHKKEGLNNPVFSYDEETMLWFINFGKVGDSKKKIPLEEIKKTIKEILDNLKVEEAFSKASVEIVEQKYYQAIELFYSKRYRPNNKRILIPTLPLENKSNIDLKFFTWNMTQHLLH